MKRSVLYVDGFNFYYGVTDFWRKEGKKQWPEENWAGLGWCDFRALIERHFLEHGQEELVSVRYFTSKISEKEEIPGGWHAPGERHRYAEWAQAVETIKGLTMIQGFHKPEYQDTRDSKTKRRSEKQNEVNMAVEMMFDALPAHALKPDKVYVLSADSDLMPAIFALAERLKPAVEVVVLLPSDADEQRWQKDYDDTRARLRACVSTGELQTNATVGRAPTCSVLTKEILAQSILPYTLMTKNGKPLNCRPEWRLTQKFLKKHCTREDWRPSRAEFVPASKDRVDQV